MDNHNTSQVGSFIQCNMQTKQREHMLYTSLSFNIIKSVYPKNKNKKNHELRFVLIHLHGVQAHYLFGRTGAKRRNMGAQHPQNQQGQSGKGSPVTWSLYGRNTQPRPHRPVMNIIIPQIFHRNCCESSTHIGRQLAMQLP